MSATPEREQARRVLRVIRRGAYLALIAALTVVAFIVWVPLGLLFGFGDEAYD